MEKTDRISPSSKDFARVPAFGLTPPPRCFTKLAGSPLLRCGQLATVRRQGNQLFGDTFHCIEHGQETDLPISGEFVLRRVRVTLDVVIAAVDERQGTAHLEAVDHLERAIVAAGGLLDVKLVTSSIGRYPAYGGAPDVRTTPGSRE